MSTRSGKRFPGKLLGAAIVVIWIILLGVLIARQRASKPKIPSKLPPALLEEQWLNIYFMGEKAGWGYGVYKPLDNGYLAISKMKMSIKAMGTDQEIDTYLESEVNTDFSIRKFSLEIRTAVQNMDIKGEVDGLELKYSITSPDNSRKQSFSVKLKEPIILMDTITVKAAEEGLEIGERFRIYTFDPSTQATDFADIEVTGRQEIESMGKKVDAYVLKTSFAGVETTYWMDDHGRTLKAEAPMGISMKLVTKSEAMESGGEASIDMVEVSSIPVERTIADPRGLHYLKARLSGLQDINNDYLDGGVQTVSEVPGSGGQEVDLAIRIPDPGPGYDLPDESAGRERMREPEPLVQSDDPRIIEKAESIAGGEKNSVAVARLLNTWLYLNINKQPTASLPSAADVLESMEGDCGEHTVLYVAMARSLGLPARIAVGVVYLDGAFYYHAWPEVWVSNESGWLPVDPTFGQFPADATHLRLAIGGLKDQLAATRFMGKLKIKIIETGND